MMTKFEKYYKDVGNYGSNFSIEIDRIRKLCCELVKEYYLKFRLSEKASHFNDPFNTQMEVTHADEDADADPLMNFELFLSNATTVDHGLFSLAMDLA
ncbi:hypothetical protein Ddye_001265 [Dipteronia dyeriana]|uniref:Uncharacterized protein n=1 Tax=Dipteronia dyeriana TaxID=168575 RepID=A0AAD9XNS2_9ROSI|nr:hypothetical protein Ddye_001265 [Dipteronia dyeriana]